MTDKFISVTTYNQNQTWHHEEIRQFRGQGIGVVSLKATIRRNAYDDQSYVRIEKWSDFNGWNVIASFPITDFPAHRLSYVRKDINSDDAYALDDTTDHLFEIGQRFIGHKTEVAL